MVLVHPLSSYREPDIWINTDAPEIQILARNFLSSNQAYLYVRDRIHHSYDIHATEAPSTALEVLEAGHGLCFAKSHLLAAILRAMGVPTGLVYQRLLLGDSVVDGYCLHGLNAIYDEEQDRWIRVDARGNKPGINAQFSMTTEKLAFQVRPELGEVDYEFIYAEPPQIIQDFYRTNQSQKPVMCRTIPSELG